MSLAYLVFPDLASAQAREAQLSAALGYPDATGAYTRYCDPERHPVNGEAALLITTVCSCEVTPYWVRDAETLLIQSEKDSLQTWEEMRAAGWFPEEPDP